MKKTDLLVGALLAMITCALGSYIFIEFVVGMHFLSGIQFYRTHGLLGKIITLGAILNLILFFILIRKNKEMMARGVVFGLILLTIITLIL